MSSVLEIEEALKQLPAQEQLKIAYWLLDEVAQSDAKGESSNENSRRTPPAPDYSARRRRIFGDKVLPNMVLVARAEERW